MRNLFIRPTRGSYDGTFKWSSGVKALMVLLLRSAADSMRQAESDSLAEQEPYVLEGARPSLAASVNDLLTKRPVWVYDVFGTLGGELPVLTEMVRRRNPDFSVDPASNVELWLDPKFFPGSKIEVQLNGRKLEAERELDQLAEAIATQWSPRGSAKSAVGKPAPHPPPNIPKEITESFQQISAAEPDQSALMNHYALRNAVGGRRI